ncbi:DUF7305 domain-containing protein [Acaryochloris marina]|uniref:DUF7305 domain-containing protein n=1 Tax=Acaryochloris marina (strain MBIC 11017) TaxID=329726 RepID=B0C0H0_ACAM1|nr:hypothetical protein [Acaryochloris marina]ABW30763.1 hypothetical protein AM1_5820 [Acaryochloris marina MBIC11017]
MSNPFAQLLAQQLHCLVKMRNSQPHQERGFALPLALGLGFIMILLGMSSMIMAQSDRITAWNRKESGASLAISEGGMARTLAQLTQTDNRILLTRNYDTINPKTGTTYLGPDGILNSGDEESATVDEWTGYTGSSSTPCDASATTITPNVTLSGAMNSGGQYELKAYRYNPTDQTGTLLVEGQHGERISHILSTLVIQSEIENFPGVLAMQGAVIRGRTLIGQHANLYYDPSWSADTSLTDKSAPSDSDRASYLNAVYSTAQDGPGNDLIAGNIVGCQITQTLSVDLPATVTSLGEVKSSTTLTAANSPYHIEELELDGTDVVTVDTTDGPVYLYVTESFELRGNAQLRNIRTDGESPRVGDLRIIVHNAGAGTPPIELYDQSCIDTAFVYNKINDLQLQGSGDGCPSSGNTNFDGVVWVEDVVSSINISPHTRIVPAEDDDIITTNGSTSGIRVPNDVSSLADVVSGIGITPTNKFGYVKSWQRVRL